MPTANDKASSPRRWLDSQTGITGSTANSVADDWYYEGQKLTASDSRTRPLTFNGFRCKGRLLQKANPGMGPGYYIPSGRDGSSKYHNPIWASTPSVPQEITLAQNKAWSKLMEKVKGDTSSLAVTAAEGREAFEMVAKRVTGLYRAYRHLRKGEFRKFLKELSVDPKRKHRSWIRSASNEASGLWLEYWFGWSPTIQDIGSAAMALSVNPVLATVTERATAGFVLPQRVTTIGSTARRTLTESGTGLVRHGAKFELSNENLFLANRLGLINPMLVAWEVVPFSFVVDWFTKFGGYIESFTDLAGLTVHEPWGVTFAKVKMHGAYYPRTQPLNRCEAEWMRYYTKRRTSLFKPLPVTPRLVNFGDSITRAATAVSLLNVLFLQGKK